MLIKGFAVKVDDAEKSDRTLVCKVSTDGLDRDGEVMLPKGADLMRYRKNPVVLFGHQHDRPAVGRSLWIDKFPNDIRSKTQFADTDFGRDLWSLYEGGYMASWSIGFDKPEWREPKTRDLETRSDWTGVKRICTSWELLEYSAVNVPANRDALTHEVASRLGLCEAMVKALTIEPVKEGHEDEGESFNPLKPYPNEHSARLEAPGKYDEIRRQNDKFGPGIHAIFGIITGPPRKSELQAIRFDKDKFTVAEARAWLREHDYKPIAFEPASEGESGYVPRILKAEFVPYVEFETYKPSVQRRPKSDVELVREELAFQRGGL